MLARVCKFAMAMAMLVMLCGVSRAAIPLAPYPTATLTVGGGETSINGGWDEGSFTVDFNGFVETVNYGQFSTPASLASALAAMFSRDYLGMGLYAKAGAQNNQDSTVITFQLATGASFGPINIVGSTTSYTLSPVGFVASGGMTPDSGVATLYFDGAEIATSAYDEGSTASSIAQDLALQVGRKPSGSVTVTDQGASLFLKATGTGSHTYSLTFSTTTSFSSSPSSGQINASTTLSPSTVYSYSAVYMPNGNVQGIADSVTGMWAYGYDNVNRLVTAQAATGSYAGQYICWSYDSFGNRTHQSISNQAFLSPSGQPCQAASGASLIDTAVTYSANNQIASIHAPANLAVSYDAAGNVTNDGYNSYVYDAESRICAVDGPEGMIGYQYDGDGNRIGKGTISAMSCDITANGYIPMTDFVLDQNGRQMAEVSVGAGSPTWVHTNVTGNGMLIATLDTNGSGQHFYLNDPLGSRRVQTDAAGIPEQICENLPYGDKLYCTESLISPTEHHFTGKERDAESGLDYFGARYYASSMGRFMSPDHPLIDQHPENPQSWNLYAYARNNPLINIDPTGLGCITDLGQGSDENHESVEFNNSINSDDCAGQHGTWVPGDVSANNTGVYRGDDGSINFQATTNTGGNVYFSSFVSGAQTDANGVGPGASIAHASTDWLSSQIVGGSLDQMMSFAANRMEPRGGGGLMALLAGPGFSLDAPDNWAGPGGMGTPQGQGDWAAMVHDYNFFTNNITIGTYFNPFVSRATAKALIQSDNNLVGHAGGAQSVKMGMLFGVVNAFQWLTHPF